MKNCSSENFIPYGKQIITKEDIEAVDNVLRSPYLTQGPVLPAFEKAICQYVGVKYSVAVNSATSALHIACLALGLGPKDLLWTSPTTFVASANCARYCGADVDFVDIDPKTGLLSISALKEKLVIAEKKGRLPKIIIPVHLAGSSCEMKELFLLSKKYSFSIIEDASHAIGGKYEDNFVGACLYSSITVFSFHPVKIITTGEGGVATTNEPELAQKMQVLRTHGIVKDEFRLEKQEIKPWYYEQQCLGFNYRMTDIQAALGLSQLERLDQIIKKRNELFITYNNLINDLPLSFLSIPKDVLSSLHLAIIRLKDNDPSLHSRVFLKMRQSHIGVQVHYLPVHLQPYYRRLGFTEGNFPNAEEYSTNAISLPIFPSLTQSNIEYIVEKLKCCFSSF